METKVFKTEQERFEAMEAVPEMKKPDQTQDEFQNQQEEEIEAIRNATISEDGAPPEPPPEETPVTPPNNETEVWNNSLRVAEDEKRSIQEESDRKLTAQREEFEKKFDEIKKEPEPEVVPQIDPDIKNLESELDRAEQALSSSNPLEDENNPLKLRTYTLLQRRLQKKKDALYAIERANSKKELNDIKQGNADLEKKRKAASEKKAQTLEYERVNKMSVDQIESFRTRHDEFKSKRPYAEMKAEYTEFGKKAAAVYWGRATVNNDEVDVAMDAYLKDAPVLLEKMKDVKKPEDLDEFLVLSELSLIKRGYKNEGGKWIKQKDVFGKDVNFPSLDIAYDNYKITTGKRGEEIFKAKQKTAEEITNAINRRSDPSEMEVPHQPGQLDTGMTDDKAIEMLDKKDNNGRLIFDEEKMAKLHQENPNNALVKEYVKCLAALGQETPFDDL